MPYPYSFPTTSTAFQATVSNPAASLCGNFINTLLKLPLLIYQFISTMIDTSGNISQTFMAMLNRPGDIKTSAAAQFSDPQWLLCNGAEYPKTTYPDLYAAIGDIYGTAPWPAPSNPANFRVPNYQCFSLAGVGTQAASTASPPAPPFLETHTYTIGGQYGEDAHVLVPGEDVPHQHPMILNDNLSALNALGAGNYLCQGYYNGNTSESYTLGSDPATIVPTIGLDGVVGGEVSADSDAIAFANYTNSYKAAPHNTISPTVAVYLYVFCGVPVTI